MFFREITEAIISFWSGCQNWVSRWLSLLKFALKYCAAFNECTRNNCGSGVRAAGGVLWEQMDHSAAHQTKCDSWLLPFNLKHLLRLKVWWAVNTRVHPQCRTQEVKHLFFKMEVTLCQAKLSSRQRTLFGFGLFFCLFLNRNSSPFAFLPSVIRPDWYHIYAMEWLYSSDSFFCLITLITSVKHVVQTCV